VTPNCRLTVGLQSFSVYSANVELSPPTNRGTPPLTQPLPKQRRASGL
jgi:hypothetical protein